MKKIQIDLHERSYSVLTGNGILKDVGEIIKSYEVKTNVALISGEHVTKLYKDIVQKSLIENGYKVQFIKMPSGEKNKNFGTVQYLYDQLLDLAFDRSSVIVALGGGVLGDTAGFVAATIFRGIDLIQIPTTLLSQVDSSIGGKVGINHERGKNLVGAFYQPKVVIVDPDVLKTLSFQERVSGFGEVIKYGIIRDKIFTNFLFENSEDILLLNNMESVNYAISRSIEIKSSIVSSDEKEDSLRMILNFGHTIGHGIEVSEGYGNFTHGEAVIVGMCGAIKLSSDIGNLSVTESDKLIENLTKIPIAQSLENLNEDNVLEAMYHDKKVKDGNIRFVLLNTIGDTVIRDDVTDEQIIETVKWIKGLKFGQK